MLFLSSLAILFTWAVIALAVIGIGSVILMILSKHYSLLDAFWMGLAISVAVLEIWNLVLPITGSVTIFLFGAGILGLTLNRSRLRNSLQSIWQSPRWLLVLGVAASPLPAPRPLPPPPGRITR